MEPLYYVALSVLCSIAVAGVTLYSIQQGWLKADLQAVPLRVRITELENEVRTLVEQRNGLINELVSARRMIATLEERIIEVEKHQRHLEKVKVLAIWPKTGTPLNQDGERRAIYDAGIDYRPLTGDRATKAQIVQELRRHHYTIIEVGAHGATDGTITLADGHVTPGWWQRAVDGKGVKIALLLVCYSDELASSFLRAGVRFVVAADGDLPDEVAVQFAREFYENYADGLDVNSAVNQARLVLPIEQFDAIVFRENDEVGD